MTHIYMFKIILYIIVFIVIAFPNITTAQVRIEDYMKNAVGVGIWYGFGTMNLDAPPDSASAEVKGYHSVLPSSVPGSGAAIGLSYGSFGIQIGMDDGEMIINKYADIQQNNVTTDDVYVKKARRRNLSIAFIFQPIRYVYVGYGEDRGNMIFEQRLPSSREETKRIGYNNKFYSVGVAFGFDPTKMAVAPVFTVYTKFHQSRDDFTGVILALGAGVYW